MNRFVFPPLCPRLAFHAPLTFYSAGRQSVVGIGLRVFAIELFNHDVPALQLVVIPFGRGPPRMLRGWHFGSVVTLTAPEFPG